MGNGEDCSHNKGGSGIVRAGDHAMRRGDIDDGYNQAGLILVYEKSCNNKKHVYVNDPNYEVLVIVNGAPMMTNATGGRKNSVSYRNDIPLLFRGDINSTDYIKKYKSGILKPNPTIKVVGVSSRPGIVATPFTVQLADGSFLDGVIASGFKIDPRDYRSIYNLLNQDFATVTDVFGETRRAITADGLRHVVQNTLKETIVRVMRRIGSYSNDPIHGDMVKGSNPVDFISEITTELTRQARDNPIFGYAGLIPCFIEISLAESQHEEYQRLVHDISLRQDLERRRINADAEMDRLRIRLALEEHDLMNQG